MGNVIRRLKLKPYTKKELASIYQISVRCLTSWIQRIKPEVGPKQGKYYTIRQVKIILDHLGLPGDMEE